MASTRLLFNADVRPMSHLAAGADAVAWRDGRLLAVGALEAVARAAGADAERWDAGGATVLPGFVDAHQHPSIGALYGGQVRLAPPAVTSIDSLLRVLATAASKLAPGEWLVANDWDERLVRERRRPTRAELDGAVPNHPLVALHYTCHRALANSRALERLGITRSTPDPPGGQISRERGGLPDGLLIERAMSGIEAMARASAGARDSEGFLARLGAHYDALLAVGITGVVDAAVPPDLLVLYREAATRGLVKVPTVLMPVSANGFFEPAWDVLGGPVTGETSGPLTMGPLKMIFDGAESCAMCMSYWQAALVSIRMMALAVRQRSASVVAQPAFLTLSTVASAPSIPGMPFVALRWLLDAGVTVAGSSDHPCAPMAPLDGIRSAVNRRTRTGALHEMEQAVSLDEALVMYTRTAARVSFGPSHGGTLERGRRADLVVLNEPLTERSLERVRVKATIVAGETAYGTLDS